MGVIPNGASGYTPQTQGFAINGSGGENLRLEQRDEASVRTNLEGTKGAENASGFNAFGGAIGGIIGGIFNGWFGGGSVGKPQEVQYTIEAIKDAIIAGYNVITVTSSGTRDIPEGITEAYAVCVGGGQTGENGQNGSTSLGGLGGGYVCEPLDVVQVSGQTLTCNIGPVGGASTVMLGAVKLAEAAPGTAGGIAAGVMGYAPTTSAPGKGGNGGRGRDGSVPGSDGISGGASAKAAGGTGGQYQSSSAGGLGAPGGNADPAAAVKSAGGGGGGGAGGGLQPITGFGLSGGPGGPGGYPGGGGGGGGGRGSNNTGTGSNGAGGIGAVGIIWLIYK